MKAYRDIIRDLSARGLLEPAKQIADKHHVHLAEVLSRKKHAPIAAARNELYAYAYDALGSYPLVGDILDRDHGTIMYGRRAHMDRVAELTAVEAERPSEQQLTLWGYNAR